LRSRKTRHPPEDLDRLAPGEIAREPMPLGQVPDAAAALGIRRGPPEEASLPCRRLRQAEQDLDGRRLARAVWAEQAEELPGSHCDIDPRQRPDPSRPHAGPLNPPPPPPSHPAP